MVVAGVRGAGKSTFLEQLNRRGLPANVGCLLPTNIDTWPQLHAINHSDWLPTILGENGSHAPIRNFVLHYDLFRLTRLVPELDPSYDPARLILGQTKALTAVLIRPEDSQLVRQYYKRYPYTSAEAKRRSSQPLRQLISLGQRLFTGITGRKTPPHQAER